MGRKAVSGMLLILFLAFALSTGINEARAEVWIPYVPSSAELIYWISNGTSYINVSMTFGDSGYNVSDWGTVVVNGSEIWVDSEIWHWTGYTFPWLITLSHTYNLGLLGNGNYTFTFKAWSSNVESTSFTVDLGEVCGVDITNIELGVRRGGDFIILPLPHVYFTWIVLVNVTMHNNGTVPINCTVNSYYFDNTTTNLIGTQNITNLLADENTTLTFEWDVEGLPETAIYTLKANATCPCGASDEFINGQVYIRIFGDGNGDGRIDILDLKLVKLVFSGLIDFEDIPWADLNGDGTVNILDLKLEKLVGSLIPLPPL